MTAPGMPNDPGKSAALPVSPSPAHIREFTLESSDGLAIACSRWSGPGPERAVVQIAHGMGEHIGRYLNLVEALTAAGFVVYGNNHRGHGRSVRSPDGLGDFGPGGFGQLVADMTALAGVARAENTGLPFILLGHSMGSFAAQQAVLDEAVVLDGLVLSGSGVLDSLAALAEGIEVGGASLNAGFEPARTPADWLSRDAARVDAFLADPHCFPMLTAGSIASLLAAAGPLADPARLRGIRPDLPVYLFSGRDDPIGQRGSGVEALVQRYRAAGLADVTCDLYPGGRHEMLNETNREVVLARLLVWLIRVAGR